MQSPRKFVVAGVAVALALFAAQAGVAKPRQGSAPAADPGWLGVSIQNLEGDIKEAMPRGVTDGAIVNSVVEDSPADKLGLEEGDIITRFNNQAIHNSDDLTAAVRDAGAGTTAEIQYYRDGRLMRDRVTLAGPQAMPLPDNPRGFRWMSRNDDRNDDGEADDSDGHTWFFNNDNHGPMAFMFQNNRPARLGVRLMDLGDQLADYFKVKDQGGALVTEVEEDSPAARAGLQAGDVIVSIDDKSVEDAGDVQEELGRHEEAGPVSVGIVRNGRPQSFTAQLEKADRNFGMRAPNMQRFHMANPRLDMPRMPQGPGGVDRQEFQDQMRDLRRQLDELKKELSDLRSDKT
jgi:serine protease Do